VSAVPVVDVRPLITGNGDAGRVAERIDGACREVGFFSVVGHGVDPALPARVAALAAQFFALEEHEKAEIAMPRGGRAWRGWFPLGGELTSGVPDHKEGLYLGAELGPDHPRVAAGVPMHGPNLFPARPAALRPAVLELLERFTTLGHALCRGLGLALGLGAEWFDDHLTADPTVLLRVFRYPPEPPEFEGWGVAEHTDYGLLTILHQDPTGGLQVRTPAGWVDVEPVDGALVCNLGDMLERMTGGRYRSTPHRVRNASEHDRLSVPFFFDPSWDARVQALPLDDGAAVVDDRAAASDRWDGRSVHAFEGTYGDYLLGKVAKVFPDLGAGVTDS
jgi:isopenicillin N synthase-like dioxygenase